MTSSHCYYCQCWNGAFFSRISLKELGLRIQLGHPPGDACDIPRPAKNDSFLIIDDHGIHEVGLDFCHCEKSKDHVTQLLRYGLYPATVNAPSTAATFRVLERFHILSFESKCSAQEFYRSLAQETDNTGLTVVRVCPVFQPLLSTRLISQCRTATLNSSVLFDNGVI